MQTTTCSTRRVFCEPNGEPGDDRDAGKRFRAAVKAAGLLGQGRLSLHSLRHGFASLLIAKKLNPVFVSRQLGYFQPADHVPGLRASVRAG
jgi:site-specific recombinase XerD